MRWWTNGFGKSCYELRTRIRFLAHTLLRHLTFHKTGVREIKGYRETARLGTVLEGASIPASAESDCPR